MIQLCSGDDPGGATARGRGRAWQATAARRPTAQFRQVSYKSRVGMIIKFIDQVTS